MNTVNTVSVNLSANVPAEPAILTANTFYWTPACNASSRRRNEARQLATVATYLAALGFTVNDRDDRVSATNGNVEVVFSYSESCSNVYKSLQVTRGGKRSNISAIRKIAAAIEFPSIAVAVAA